MRKFSAVATVAALLATVSTPALSQGLEQWGTGGGWDILIDTTLGDDCFTQSEFEDGSLVRMGIDKDQGTGYVTIFNTACGDIEEGAVYPIEFELDDERYDGEARGIYLNDVPGADILFDNADFFADLALKYTMTIYNENGRVLAISLQGTQVGLEGVLQCQEEVDNS